MSDKEYQKPPQSERIPAKDLRVRISDKITEKAQKEAAQSRSLDEEKQKAYQQFLERKFTEADRLQFRSRIERAADQGLFELEVLKFPSDYLEDRGRRINNRDKDWPVSLTGYAKSLYDAFMDLAQPQGYRLIARVLDYPDGMPGNVGIYVSWQ